jgi:hypothetical protein
MFAAGLLKSQNGLTAEPPQRHSAICGRARIHYPHELCRFVAFATSRGGGERERHGHAGEHYTLRALLKRTGP